jgi:hypothetical protein
MHDSLAWGRRWSGLAFAGLLLLALPGCESGPSFEQLAPKIPKLNPDVPETTHPESADAGFPNINNAPDRPSVMYRDPQVKQIEENLENLGDTHVKKALKSITGSEDGTGKGSKAGDDGADAEKLPEDS